MSVQVLNSDVYSNTKIKQRQPKQEDAQFARVLSQIRATRQAVEDAGDVGDWKDTLQEINAAALSNRLDSALEALARSNPRLSSILATLPDFDQEELHPDFRIGKQGKKVFKTLSEDEIEGFPDIEEMISGLLQTASTSLLFSESNIGKTFVALDIAEHKARGIPWLGRRVKPGPVLYIYAESKLGLKPRIMAWKKHHNLPSTPNLLRFITRPVQLVNDREMLLDTIAEQEVTPELVIIDTFSNCATGINQNDQADVYRVLATAHEIVREYGSHVMIVHHTNKSDSVNGSAAFKNHVDTMIKLSRADKYSPIVMHCEKQRDAEQFDDICLQLEVVNLYINPETLEPVTSCVVVASSEPATSETGLSQTQQKMLDILTLQGRTSFNAWKKACEDAKVAKPTSFYMHVQTLVEQGQVRKEAEGPGKKTWYEVLIETSSTSSKLVQTELDEPATN